MKIVSSMTKALGAALALLVVTLIAAPPSMAAVNLTVSASQNLTDGQVVEVSGTGFTAGLKGIAIGQCIEGYKGPADCNVAGGASFKDANAQGVVAKFTIKVKVKFGANDCSKVKCVIASGPLPSSADAATIKANEFVIPISFGGTPAAPAAPAAPVVAPVAVPVADVPVDTTGALPKTGVADNTGLMLMGGAAMLLLGLGVRFAVPGSWGRV